MAFLAVSCSKDDNKENPEKTNVTKIADYLYEYTAEEYDSEAPSELLTDDGLWFTSHNSTYDIANKTLWVTIREKYEKHYDFKL